MGGRRFFFLSFAMLLALLPAQGRAACIRWALPWDGCTGHHTCPASHPNLGTDLRCKWGGGCNRESQDIRNTSLPHGMVCTGSEKDVTNDPKQVEVILECCTTSEPVIPPAETNTSTGSSTAAQTQTQTQTQSQTQTQTEIQTQTQTQLQSSPTTSTQTVAQPYGQDKAQKEAEDMLDITADQVVTLGAVNCVEAMNKAGDGSPEAEALMGNCLVELDTAKQLKDAANKTAVNQGKSPKELAAIEELVNSDRSRRIFAEFEEKYGASGEALARKLIGEGFSASDLEGLLSRKIPPEKFQELVAAAEAEAARKRQEAQDQLAYDLKGPGKKLPSVRDKLKETLKKEATAAARKPASPPAPATTPKPGEGDYGGLKPLTDLFPGQGAASEKEELDLFQVVRRKYREKWEMLVPYRAPRP